MRFKTASFFNPRISIAFSLMVILVILGFFAVGCETKVKSEAGSPPNDLYGGIEIGSKGVKATILEAKYNQPTNEDDPGRTVQESMPLETTNTTLMADLDKDGNFSKTALEDTVKAVKSYYDKLRSQNVTPEQIYIIGSSGLLKANQASRDALSSKITEVTNTKMRYLTAQLESEYSIIGIIPKAYRSNAFLIDIGSGNTKGGYIENHDTDLRFVTMEVPLGSVTATNEIDKAATNDYEVILNAERVRANVFEPALSKDLSRKSGFVNRKRLYLSGGMNWAVATLRHPGIQDKDGMVTLTVQDIDDFTYLAKKDPQKLLNPDLSGIKDDATRKRVEKEIQKVGDTFTQKNLVAGGELLQAIVSVCKLKDKGKHIYFTRFGQTGWLYKFIETTIESKPKS